MPTRATKRGDERTALDLDCDVLICGASFAGLTVARELARSPARPRVVVIDRYEIGERQTSACAVPGPWLKLLGLTDAALQEFGEIVAHTPRRTFAWALPEPFVTFDYRRLCALLADQGDFAFETAKVEGIAPADRTDPAGARTVLTDRGPVRAPLVVDALGWRRVLAPPDEDPIQPPEAFLSRGLEVHPGGRSDELALYLNPRYVPDGYSWSFPAGDEVRVGVGSFDPHQHVKDPTLRLVGDLGREPEGFQGNWIPHRLRSATGGGVFFVGDSAGHCLPLTAEGIRPAFHFGLALGRELRHVVEGRQTREQALARYASISAQKAPAYRWLLGLQRVVGRVIPRRRTLDAALRATVPPGVARRAWGAYFATISASSWEDVGEVGVSGGSGESLGVSGTRDPEPAGDPDDRGPSDRGPSDGGSSDRDPSDRDPSDRGPSDRDPSDRGPSDRDPSDRDPSVMKHAGRGAAARVAGGAAPVA